MKKLTLLTTALLLSSTIGYSAESCHLYPDQMQSLTDFADGVNEVTAGLAETQKVLDVTVTKFYKNQGNGKVSVITDEKGNISAVRVDFSLQGKKTTLLKTFEELNSGGKLQYIDGNSKNAALSVQKASGANLSAQNGGKFTFSVLTKKPNSYAHHTVYLRKDGNSWVAKNENGSKLSSVDLTPNVSGLEWNGTFSSATFE